MRLAKYRQDEDAEKRWRSRLSPSKEKKVERLLKRTLLKEALDALLPIRGLWKALTLGSLDNFLDPGCDEVSCSSS